MDLIQFEAGTKASDAKVTINGVDYPVTPARYTGNTPLSAYIFNLMQSNIAEAVVPTGGTTGQVLVKKSNTDNDVEWQTVVANVVQTKSNSTTDVYSCDYINKAIEVNKETNKEVATNEYIDGKRVYVKRIDFGALPNASSKTVSTGLNVNEVTICKPLMGYAYGIDINNIHYVMTLPDVAPNYPEGATRLTMSSSNSIYNIIITTGIDRSNYNGYVDIYYTKTTD